MIRFVLLFVLLLWSLPVRANDDVAGLIVDAQTGTVLWQVMADQPRYPASVTKMMTAYVALSAIRAGEISADSPITVSAHAAAQGGARLGLRTGDTITVSQALQAIIVRSANDAAVAIAEKLALSELAFAARMTETARVLGMTATAYRNASGITAAGHQTTARDMALLALALYRDFPDYADLFSARSMRWRHAVHTSVNGYLVSVAGAEGMKTGFTCSAGYNLVASATRQGRRIVIVVLGAASKAQRLSIASQWTERGFTLPPTGPALVSLPNGRTAPPDFSRMVCGYDRNHPVPPVIPGETYARSLPQKPGGWAVELAFGREEQQVHRWITALHAQFAADLGGGMALVTMKPFHGDVRYRGLIVGLQKDRAVSTCLALRNGGENRCLVLNPDMVQGAIDEEWRLRMSMAE